MEKINNLARICMKSQEQLLKWLKYKMYKYYEQKKVKITSNYLYIKGTLPVCLVAHLDTVHAVEPQKFYYDIVKKSLFSPTGIGGDDRCGVYIILELLKRGLRPSIIFCCDEECGGLGAKEFIKVYKTINNVNWFLEFDRRGRNDVICYDDDNNKLTKVFESFGFKSAYGSFSDISVLAPHFGISAVNVSSGYYNPHTINEYINIDDVDWVIDTAEQILKSEYVNEKYEYVEYEYVYDYSSKKYSDVPKGYSVVDYSSKRCLMCDSEKDVKPTEIGMLCDECIKEIGLYKCPLCGEYTYSNIHNTCNFCGALLDIEEESADGTS